MDDIDDIFWETELSCNVGKDRRWIIPDQEDLEPPESINSSENDAMTLYTFKRGPRDTIVDENAKRSLSVIVRILEERGRGVWDAVGGEVWEASLLLSIWLRLSLPTFAKEGVAHVMELGCGVALPTLYISNFLVTHQDVHQPLTTLKFTMTDHDSCLLQNLADNMVDVKFCPQSPISLTSTLDDQCEMQQLQVAKLDWTLFDKEHSSEEYDALIPSSLNRHNFDLLYGSALCYAPCHKCLAYLIKYYLSGRCKEVIVVQIADREGFQDLVKMLSDMQIRYTLEDIPPMVYDVACTIETRQSLIGGMTANSADSGISSDSIRKFVEYSIPCSFPSEDIHEKDFDIEGISMPAIKTAREYFALLRVFQ